MNLNEIINLISLETIKKYSYAIKILILIVFAYIIASIVNSEFIDPLIDIKEEKKGVSSVARSFKVKQSRRREYYDIIIERNIFDSTGKPVPGGLSQVGFDEGVGPDSPAVPTTLPVKLVGTMVLNNPSWSLAVITGGAKRQSNIYRINDILLSSAVVAKIQRNKVILRNNGRLEYIEIKEKATEFVTEHRTGDIEVNQVGDDKYVISRMELNEAFSDLGNILTQARVIPHFEDGKTTGFKIFAIQPGSIYKKLGLNNHDIIARVNGVLVDDPTKGLQMFNSLKSEKKIELDIIRNGVKRTLNYEIK